MDISEFYTAQKSEWILTDDDCCQLRRTDEQETSNLFELIQILSFPGNFREAPHQGEDYYRIAHGTVDISEYSEDEIQAATAMYGYDERPEPGILAEMLFETEFTEFLEDAEYGSFNDAVSQIENITGLNLHHVKEKEQHQVEIWQLDTDKQAGAEALFLDYESNIRHNGSFNPDLYACVWKGPVMARDLEDVYTVFNIHHPQDFKGHSLSVSDVVKFGSKHFFCDSFGFKEVSFERTKSLEDRIQGAKASVSEQATNLYPQKDISSKIDR